MQCTLHTVHGGIDVSVHICEFGSCMCHFFMSMYDDKAYNQGVYFCVHVLFRRGVLHTHVGLGLASSLLLC